MLNMQDPLTVLIEGLLYSVCATHQSHVTSCQIRNIFAWHVSKVKGRYGNVDKYFSFTYFEMIQRLKHFTVIIRICSINLGQKINLYNDTKCVFTY